MAPEKPAGRRIAEPSTGGADGKPRGLAEAMRAGRGAGIRGRMMAVRGVPGGYHASGAACLADVERRTVRLWAERPGAGGPRDTPCRGRNPRVRHGHVGRLADRLGRMGMPAPGKLRNAVRRKPGRAHGPRHGDGASRFATGYGMSDGAAAANAPGALEGAVGRHGKPAAVMTDRGPRFHANEREAQGMGVSTSGRELAGLGMRQALAGVGIPGLEAHPRISKPAPEGAKARREKKPRAPRLSNDL